MPHVFLTAEWIEEMLALLDEYRHELPQGSLPRARANITVHEVPFGDGRVLIAADTTHEQPTVTVGHLPDADITISLAYAVAHDAVIRQRPDELARAWLMGKIKVDGDLMKLLPTSDTMAMVAKANTVAEKPIATELSVRIRAVTAPS